MLFRDDDSIYAVNRTKGANSLKTTAYVGLVLLEQTDDTSVKNFNWWYATSEDLLAQDKSGLIALRGGLLPLSLKGLATSPLEGLILRDP